MCLNRLQKGGTGSFILVSWSRTSDGSFLPRYVRKHILEYSSQRPILIIRLRLETKGYNDKLTRLFLFNFLLLPFFTLPLLAAFLFGPHGTPLGGRWLLIPCPGHVVCKATHPWRCSHFNQSMVCPVHRRSCFVEGFGLNVPFAARPTWICSRKAYFFARRHLTNRVLVC